MKFLHVDIRRLVLVVVSVIVMGFCLSFLNLSAFGTDPCTCMNLGISAKIGWTLGNWQATLNCCLFVIVFLFGRNQIGWGTIANMFLVGYSFDFFSWVNSHWIPASALNSAGAFDSMLVRVLVAIPALFVFVLAASAYMASDLGTSPYDAISFIIASRQKKLSFRAVRIIYDVAVCLIALAFGAKLGAVTVVMAFVLGPVITWMKVNVVEKYIPLSSPKKEAQAEKA